MKTSKKKDILQALDVAKSKLIPYLKVYLSGANINNYAKPGDYIIVISPDKWREIFGTEEAIKEGLIKKNGEII